MIDWNRPVTTKGGNDCRFYAHDGSTPFHIHGAVNTGNGWLPISWNEEGKAYLKHRNFNLENIPEKREGWINVYPSQEDDQLFESEKEANAYAVGRRIKCIRIEYEV